MTSSLLIVFHGVFLVALFLLQWWRLSAYPLWTWGAIATGTIIAMCTTGWDTRARRIMLTLLFAISLALIITSRTVHTSTTTDIETYAENSEVTIWGQVISEPDRRPMHTKYTINAEKFSRDDGKTIESIRGKVLISDHAGWPQFSYGDTLEVRGNLKRPEVFDDFDYASYLELFEIRSFIPRASVTRVRRHESSIFGTLYFLKETFESQLNSLYPEPHASFLAGLLTGSRRGIPEKTLEDFHATGLTHIIAISGYNITILLTVVGALLLPLPLRWRLLPSIIAIIFFVLFTGASAPVIRAGIMGGLSLLALHSGRAAEKRLLILWTASLMAMWNPHYLWTDVSFQLSFLAVIGLLEGKVLLDPLCKRLPHTLGIREAMQMTLAAQIFALPVIIVSFGRLSLIAPLANLLVAPAIPIAMLFGFLSVVASFISFPLGQLLGIGAWISLTWMITVADLLAQLPLASIETGATSPFFTLLYFSTLIGLLLWQQRRRSTQLSSRYSLETSG